MQKRHVIRLQTIWGGADMEERAYQYWLHNLPGVGDRRIEKLLKVFGSAKEIYNAGTKTLEKVLGEKAGEKIVDFTRCWDIEKSYEKLISKNILFLTVEDRQYPERLKKLEHPPYALYCMGKLPEEQRPAAAVIGARECSEYGSYVARAFAGEMAKAGVSIVSGMARGIDGIGQRAAIERKGKTYAVLGCGVDVCYPASNRRLYQEIIDMDGGILSSFPPGTQPLKRHFPERNRIVAGLSDVVLVVEARLKSGTWITVDMALEQGKSVYAVPGRLTDRLSDGCNYLIRQGAGIALTPKDVLSELSVLENRKGINGNKWKEEQAKEPVWGKQEEGIVRFLDGYPKSPDEIMENMQKSGETIEFTDLLAELMELCMEKKIRRTGGNYFVRVYDG